MKKKSLIFRIAIVLLLSVFVTGCGEDEVSDVENLYEDEVSDVESLYKELVGTYELFKSEVTYVDQPKEVFKPPQFAGTMTISSDQRITQKFGGEIGFGSRTGTFEILTDEGALFIKDGDVTLRAAYTWDGTILTIAIIAPKHVEKGFWRKISNSVIELQPPEPEFPPELEPPPSAAFVSANPPSGSKIAANATIILIFDNAPADVTVSAGIVRVAGRTAMVFGPFTPGPLALTVVWADGSQTLTYTVVAPDVEPPMVTGATVRDGEKDVDPDLLNNDGIEITFSEEVDGNIALQTEGGDDVGWIGWVGGNKAALEPVAGKEIGNETTYVIKGKVSDAAGNEAEISITFVTKVKG